MAALIYFGAAILLVQVQSQCVPRLPQIPQLPPQIAPQCTTPVVASTIIDNSVSNALANAIQLLIVSNLIENTMNKNIPNCNSVPVCPNIVPDFINPCDTIAPCDVFIPSYDTINIPNVCLPEVIPITPTFGCDCGNYYPSPNIGRDCSNCYPNILPVANIGCDCPNCYPNILPVANIGCDCPNCYPNILPVANKGCDCPNYYPNILPVANIGCDCPNYYPSCECNYYPLPNYGRDQPLYPNFGPIFPCDAVGPMTAEVLLPSAIPAQLSCNFGCNNVSPCSLNVDPWAGYIEPCGCIKNFGNGFYR